MTLRKQIRIEYWSEENLERSANSNTYTNEPIDEIAHRKIGFILERAIDKLPTDCRIARTSTEIYASRQTLIGQCC